MAFSKLVKGVLFLFFPAPGFHAAPLPQDGRWSGECGAGGTDPNLLKPGLHFLRASPCRRENSSWWINHFPHLRLLFKVNIPAISSLRGKVLALLGHVCVQHPACPAVATAPAIGALKTFVSPSSGWVGGRCTRVFPIKPGCGNLILQ